LEFNNMVQNNAKSQQIRWLNT